MKGKSIQSGTFKKREKERGRERITALKTKKHGTGNDTVRKPTRDEDFRVVGVRAGWRRSSPKSCEPMRG